MPKVSSLTPLNRAYKVDEAINTPQNHLVIVRFGKDESICGKVDEWLKSQGKTYEIDAKAYAVAMKDVPELVARYKLVDDVTILFFADNVQVHRLNLDAATSSDHEQKLKGTFEVLVEHRKNQRASSGNQSGINNAPPSGNPSAGKTTRPFGARRMKHRQHWN